VDYLVGLLGQEEADMPASMGLDRYGSGALEAIKPLLFSSVVGERYVAMSLIGGFATNAKDAAMLELIRPCLSDSDPNIRTECEYLFAEFAWPT